MIHINKSNSSAKNIKQCQFSMQQVVKFQNTDFHVMAHTCNPCTLQGGAGGLLVWSHCIEYIKYLISQRSKEAGKMKGGEGKTEWEEKI